jgi:type II secretory pathway component PulK
MIVPHPNDGFAQRRRQRGVAFVLVMWVIAMLSVLLGSFALVARTEGLQSRHLFDTTTARYAAEAGLNLAVYALSRSDPTQKWVADGRVYAVTFDEIQVELEITDDSTSMRPMSLRSRTCSWASVSRRRPPRNWPMRSRTGVTRTT